MEVLREVCASASQPRILRYFDDEAQDRRFAVACESFVQKMLLRISDTVTRQLHKWMTPDAPLLQETTIHLLRFGAQSADETALIASTWDSQFVQSYTALITMQVTLHEYIVLTHSLP